MAKVVINGVEYASNNSKTPYSEIASAYANQARANLGQQQKAMQSQLAQSKAGAAANFDSNAAQAYINYAKQQNALPEQLRAQGINGGASESAMVRMQNQFAQNQAQNNAARGAAMAELQNAYDTNLANLQNSTNEAILSNNLAMAQQQAQYTDTMNQRALEQYQATIERFTSVKSVDKAIKSLKKSDPNYAAKKQLLQLRKAQIKAAKKSSGGGGGRRSYGGYSSGGGSYSSGGNVSSGTATKVADNVVKNTVNAITRYTDTATRGGKTNRRFKVTRTQDTSRWK